MDRVYIYKMFDDLIAENKLNKISMASKFISRIDPL